jgi:hypothetical protein
VHQTVSYVRSSCELIALSYTHSILNDDTI